ncbi:MAG TPA: hypothetical protein VL484_19005 [Vicinamibacterales bacterium]|jgi:hypothetical protein|nr:hypothetical protein [Vicinamibacterales bacterium]
MTPYALMLSLLFAWAIAVLWRTRRYAFAWGATPDELGRNWPGDELCPGSRSVATRAIAIDAPADVVWSYIAQIGQDRAGFYSYTRLENLFRCAMPNVSAIVPAWQHRKAGETVWLARADRYKGEARLKVARVDERRDLVLTSPADWGRVVRKEHAREGAWALVVIPTGATACRLIVRSRGPEGGGVLSALTRALVFDPAHFIMERRMMRHIKQLAEVSAARH